jgi:ubiquinone/menaquinone biosynthesis C-methylase UbiE
VKEIESNKEAWSKISEEHYHTFKESLMNGTHRLNEYIQWEISNLSGKKVIHLQCNTGADTFVLAKTAAHVTGVDLVPENIHYAEKLAKELGYANVNFIESDIMTLVDIHDEKYDIVFTSEGALGWLPDLQVWAKTVRKLLRDDGFLYVFDSHPFYFVFDESKIEQEIYEIKYPYFGKKPSVEDTIGGYASEVKHGVKAYFWMHPISELINSLAHEGLHIEFFNEYTENFFNAGHMKPSPKVGLFQYEFNTDKYPMSYSLKASVYKSSK